MNNDAKSGILFLAALFFTFLFIMQTLFPPTEPPRPPEGSPQSGDLGDLPNRWSDSDGSSMEAMRSTPNSNKKIGVIGTCSGGRHAFLVACKLQGFDAAVD